MDSYSQLKRVLLCTITFLIIILHSAGCNKNDITYPRAIGQKARITCLKNCSDVDTETITFLKENMELAYIDRRSSANLTVYGELKGRPVSLSKSGSTLIIDRVELADDGRWTCLIKCRENRYKIEKSTMMRVTEYPTINVSLGHDMLLSHQFLPSSDSPALNRPVFTLYPVTSKPFVAGMPPRTLATYTISSRSSPHLQIKLILADGQDKYQIFRVTNQTDFEVDGLFFANRSFTIDTASPLRTRVLVKLWFLDTYLDNHFFEYELALSHHGMSGLLLFAHIFVLMAWIIGLFVVAFVIYKMYQNEKQTLKNDDDNARLEWRYGLFGVLLVLFIPFIGLLAFVYLTRRWQMLSSPQHPGLLQRSQEASKDSPEKEKLKPQPIKYDDKLSDTDEENNVPITIDPSPDQDLDRDLDRNHVVMGSSQGTETEV